MSFWIDDKIEEIIETTNTFECQVYVAFYILISIIFISSFYFYNLGYAKGKNNAYETVNSFRDMKIKVSINNEIVNYEVVEDLDIWKIVNKDAKIVFIRESPTKQKYSVYWKK
jgi:hypothetical protein